MPLLYNFERNSIESFLFFKIGIFGSFFCPNELYSSSSSLSIFDFNFICLFFSFSAFSSKCFNWISLKFFLSDVRFEKFVICFINVESSSFIWWVSPFKIYLSQSHNKLYYFLDRPVGRYLRQNKEPTHSRL